jgi:hypothetical protein
VASVSGRPGRAARRAGPVASGPRQPGDGLLSLGFECLSRPAAHGGGTV